MTILSEETRYIVNDAGTVLIVLIIACCAISYGAIVEDLNKMATVLVVSIIVLIILAILFGFDRHRTIKVTLQDDYPAVELLEKYDVIEQDGKILTLQEKEPIGKEEE